MPNYRVVFHEETIREFIIPNCRTPEEAEVTADMLWNDGEGTVTSSEVVSTEVEEIEDEL